MPRTLFIDASTPTLYVGAYADNAWLTLLQQPQSQTMESLFAMTGELFTNYPLAQFDQICICEGPGRLMSLRIVATAANQWASQIPQRLVFTSLGLLSTHLGQPCAYELRKGTHLLYSPTKLEVIASAQLPEATPILHSTANMRTPAHGSYLAAVEAFPKLAPKLTALCDFYNPPLYAPLSYALAKPEAISKEG